MNKRFEKIRSEVKLFKDLNESESFMEVKIEQREAIKIIRTYLGLPASTKIFIKPGHPLKEKFVDKVKQLEREKGKINAIKYVRAVCSAGLAESKFFVDGIDANGEKFLNGEDIPGINGFDENKVEAAW